MHTHIIFVVILPVSSAHIHIRCIYLAFFLCLHSNLRHVLVLSTWKDRVKYSQTQFSIRAICFFIHFSWQNFPFSCGSHFIWILFWFALSVSPNDPCTILTMSFIPCSALHSSFCLQLEYSFYKPWQQQFLLCDSHILDFPVKGEPLNCMFATNPGL